MYSLFEQKVVQNPMEANQNQQINKNILPSAPRLRNNFDHEDEIQTTEQKQLEQSKPIRFCFNKLKLNLILGLALLLLLILFLILSVTLIFLPVGQNAVENPRLTTILLIILIPSKDDVCYRKFNGTTFKKMFLVFLLVFFVLSIIFSAYLPSKRVSDYIYLVETIVVIDQSVVSKLNKRVLFFFPLGQSEGLRRLFQVGIHALQIVSHLVGFAVVFRKVLETLAVNFLQIGGALFFVFEQLVEQAN